MSVRFIKSALCLIFALGLLSALIITYRVYTQLTKPMIVSGDPIILEIKPNSSANSLLQTLYNKNLIQSKSMFLQYIKYKSLANRLKTGVYQIKPGESAMQLIDRIVAGDVLSLSFRIIDGTSQSVIAQNLTNAPFLNYSESDWEAISASHPNAEGLLLADTYQYDAGSDAKRLLQRANKGLLDYLALNWGNRSEDLPYRDAYEMLIAASILEKETALPNERQIISGIIANRLKKNMPLQMDPTVIYGLGARFTGKLSHKDMAFNSPYNTYRYRGLPPTPIAMVGRNAIDAAAHPQRSNFLYFVAKGDGTHVFSETYAEQRKAIANYLNKGS